MEYISTLDKKIDDILDNNIFYSILMISLILYCTFISTSTDSIVGLTMDNILIKILIILCILYFSTKDIRISLLLTIILLLEFEKLNMDDIKANLVALMVKDSMLDERLSKLEKK